jgi:hypothetical protein
VKSCRRRFSLEFLLTAPPSDVIPERFPWEGVRIQGGLVAAKAQHRVISLFHATMILLDPSIQISIAAVLYSSS